jgi:hypothetical protein
MINPLDEVLDTLEDLTADCPKPMLRTHCDYCLTWIVIMEDILKVNEDDMGDIRCATCLSENEPCYCNQLD